MRKNKMGSLFLISVLALAGIGISYAGWTDTITVTGTVETGDVDINVIGYSGTWVWKTIDDHGLIRHHSFSDPALGYNIDPFALTGNVMLVSSAWAEPGAEDDSVKVTFDNLFPCQDFTIDFLMHYDGSIPARLQGPILIDTTSNAAGENFKASGMNWLEYLWYEETLNDGGDISDGGIGVEAYSTDVTGTQVGESIDVGDQFEFCDYIYVKLIIHIPQDQDYMNLEGTFDTMFEVIQWNEFGTTGDGCGEETTIGHHADVALCLDTSGSVAGQPLADLKIAAKAFVNVLVNDDGMVAVAGFAATGYPVIALTKDQTALDTAIDGLTASGTTNPGAGISIAQDYLDNEPTTPDDRTDDSTYPDFMVIITDGNPVPAGDAPHIAAAQDAKDAGTKIYVIGIGSVDPTFCQALSSGTGYYFPVTNYAALEAILLGLVSI